ncbi:aryl hydrocarbon receptor-like, partial [Plectropomus leopardus]|uniref:aryl hydrocarbon receptor-like n=1 Tax=Plectropomus leopardus TaxID=160734 RepID=UPI001C4DC00C
MKTGESGFTVFRLLAKTGMWIWVQANARVVFKAGKPDFIVARQRALTNEEGEEQLRLRRLQLPFNFTTGEALLYDITPSVDVPDPCSAPKQRKLDSYTVSRDSILGAMLSQDQSLYCENSNGNTLNSANDIAFQDTHATVNVPGDVWQLTTPKPVMGSLVKAEATVQDMMETLQQILGENDLADALDVGPEELKSWESTLLKMNTCEMNEDLDDILSNDILSYVEEQLQREGRLKLPDQIDDIPDCLSMLELQNQNPEQGGELGWPLENQLMPNGGQTMKLTHMDLPQMSLNGPTLQEISSQQALPNSVQLGAPGDAFNGPMASQLRNMQAAAKDLGAFSQNSHTNQMSQTMQMRTPNVPIGLQDQSVKRHPVFTFQGNQWNSSVPNQADAFVETYTQNISNETGFPADPSSSSCLQGHFALQTQNSDNQRQSWSREQPLISGGHQQMSLNQMSGFQGNPGLVTSHAVNSRPMFRTPDTSDVLFPVQPVLEPQPLAPSSSCMFRNAPAAVPANRAHLSQAPSCQRLNPNANQIPSKPSCFYQGLPGGGAVPGTTAIPGPDEAALSCQMTAGLNTDSLLVQQQPYLSFSEQTQINSRPVVGNGGFPFSSLPNGNAYYSENK